MKKEELKKTNYYKRCSDYSKPKIPFRNLKNMYANTPRARTLFWPF